jgi:hypothetical protein
MKTTIEKYRPYGFTTKILFDSVRDYLVMCLERNYLSDKFHTLTDDQKIMLTERVEEMDEDNIKFFLIELPQSGSFELAAILKAKADRTQINFICKHCKFQDRCKKCEYNDLKHITIWDYMKYILDMPDIKEEERQERLVWLKEHCRNYYIAERGDTTNE